MSDDLTAIKQDSFITIIDEADDDVFVNVVLNIEQAWVLPLPTQRVYSMLTALCRPEPLADKPIKGLEPDKAPSIPRKPKKEEPVAEANGVSQPDDKHELEEDAASRDLKRAREDEVETAPSSKKAKVANTAIKDDEVSIVDVEAGTGAIVIDD